jgi:myo-inositol 2-dehydrogenase/D-chiro-inositol 1-dehydrogenase
MRVGIVGAGTMGSVHAAAWRSTEARLVGCSSAQQFQSDQLARLHGIRIYRAFSDLLEDVDIVDICTPTAMHRSMVLEAAHAGKHVLCEKPVALRQEDAEAMIQACDEAGVRLFVCMVVRFFPQYRLAKDLVSAGRIGDLTVMRLKRVSYPPQKKVQNWYIDEARSGGMIVDLMIHDFDFARWLGGDVERVFARRTRTDQGSAEYAQAILRFRSGAIGLIEGGWAYPPGIFRTSFDLSGSDGLIEWSSDQPGPVHVLRAPGAEDLGAVGLPVSGIAEDPYTIEIRHAYDAIRTGKSFEVTPGDALQSLRIALAARESTETNQPATL